MTAGKPPKFLDPARASPLDAIIENAKNQVLDVISGAIDDTGMSKRQAALMAKELVGRWRLTRVSLWDAAWDVAA